MVKTSNNCRPITTEEITYKGNYDCGSFSSIWPSSIPFLLVCTCVYAFPHPELESVLPHLESRMEFGLPVEWVRVMSWDF